MTERGWTSSEAELLRSRVLNAAYDAGGSTRVQSLTDTLGADSDQVNSGASALVSGGLATRTDIRMGVPQNITLTDQGKAAASEQRSLRSDPAKRMLACRAAFLDWCYAQDIIDASPDTDDFARDTRAHFYGEPFTEAEIVKASGILHKSGLIDGIEIAESAGILRPTITARGRAQVEEGDLQRSSADQGTAVTFNGPVSGQVVIGDNASPVQNNGVDSPDLAGLLRAVAEAAAGTPEQDRVSAIVTQVQLEVKDPEPDRTFLQKSLARLDSIAGTVGKEALKGSVAALIFWGRAHLGI